jgi:DNA excision repair protein ERCC-2
MSKTKTIKISVRNLVEFVLVSGDIVSGFSGSTRSIDGIRAHQAVQKAGGDNYTAEVSVSYVKEYEDLNIEISGRIDGVIKDGGKVIIDEIKSTDKELDEIHEDYNPLHWAQAKCYAYIYCIENSLDASAVRLTYYQIDSKEIKYFNREFALAELDTFFHQLVSDYVSWARVMKNWGEVRDASIRVLEFPFSTYRKGQRELAVAVYKTLRDERKLFVQAPTGIGKTLASLFPSVKALGEGLTSKLFYLTAKNTNGALAESALDKMRKEGLSLKSVVLTAKEKICFKDKVACNPQDCEYAKGHYDRIKAALADIFQQDSFTREVIAQYSLKHTVCPFEFSLDLTNWADCVICDYNYAFDPRVYLKRFFMEPGDYFFLIDEAHNLVDRGRDMYSAELFKKDFLHMKKETAAHVPTISKSLNKINTYMVKLRKDLEETEEGTIISKEPPDSIFPLLRKFIHVSEKWLVQNIQTGFREDLLQLYFDVTAFLRTSEFYDERYVTYTEKAQEDVKIKLFCLDPSYLLGEMLKKGKSAVFFSATLTPMEYFMKLTGGDEDSYKLVLPSPFPRENLNLIIDDTVSTKFKNRESTYDKITEIISRAVSHKKGNYLIFFPSYKYLNEIHSRFTEICAGVKTICQKSSMKDSEREEFLAQFSEDNEESLIGFAVMGGVFGEGIDLTGNKLCGAVIIGVGLPQLSLERNIIKDYFDEKNGSGFEYSYVYPGMNKVMQAVGRVIRTETDKGLVLLIDERFSEMRYKKLFPKEWEGALRVKDINTAEDSIKKFWEVNTND